MPDVIEDGRYGRNEGIKCHKCSGKTYLTDDQGRGLKTYECESCGEHTMVQFEYDDPAEQEEGDASDYLSCDEA